MSATILDGKRIAAETLADLAGQVATLRERHGTVPKLVAVLVGDDPASVVYVRNKERAAKTAGVASEVRRLPGATTQQQLLGHVSELNQDPAVHGILVQLPLPPGLDVRPILLAIDPAKDVDCFHPINVGLLAEGSPRFLPCTPAAVQTILVRSRIPIAGRHVAIVGRSNLVGRPLAIMLSQKGLGADATVTLCHSRTANLGLHIRLADIVIAAAGSPSLITAEMIRPGAVVIDVGANRLADGRLVGDVDFEAVKTIAAAITPVPGGVGPMTCAMVVGNTVRAAGSRVK